MLLVSKNSLTQTRPCFNHDHHSEWIISGILCTFQVCSIKSVLLIKVLTQMPVPLQGDNEASSSKKNPPSPGQCLWSSYQPCSYLDWSLQGQIDLALEEAGTLPTYPLKPRKQSILVTERVKTKAMREQTPSSDLDKVNGAYALGQTSCPGP